MPTEAPSREEAIALLQKYFAPSLEQKAEREQLSLVDFCEQKFYIPETREPVVLVPHQKLMFAMMFDEAWAIRLGVPSGFVNYIYSTVKKSGKTSVASMIGRWAAEEWGIMNEIYCLGYQTSIKMADGTSRKIYEIVRDKDKGPVLSLNPYTNQLEPKRIINWYRSKLNGRKWVQLIHHLTPPRGNAKGLVGPWLTEDHPVLTPDGYVPAGQLTNGSMVVSGAMQPSNEQMSVIIGTVLGDGYLNLSNSDTKMGNSALVMLHSSDQIEWISTKVKALSGLGPSDLRYDPNRDQFSWSSNASLPLTLLREQFYAGVNGEKVVPRDLVEKYFSPLMLLTLLLDDGFNNHDGGMTVCSQGFNNEDNIWLREFLTSKGYKTYIRNHTWLNPGNERKYGNLLAVSAEAIRKLIQEVGHAIPSTMQYKFRSDMDVPFQSETWNLKRPEPFVTHIEINTENPPKHTSVFCIDVEDNHNFIGNNLVLHNCLANDLEQSRGRVYDKIVKSLKIDPRFDQLTRTIPNYWRIIERDLSCLPTQSVIRAVSSDYKGEAGANPTLTLWSELWGYCISGDSEILTNKGWIRADAIQGTESFAALLPDGTMRYETPSSYHTFKMNGDMVRFQHRRGDFLVTPNHRVYGQYIKNTRDKAKAEARGWWFERADDLANGKYSVGWLRADCAGLLGETAATQEDINRAKMYGYYIAEGCIEYYCYKEKREPVGILIAQSLHYNEDKHYAIGATLEALKYEPTPSERGWRVNNKTLALELSEFGKSSDKYVPDWIKFGSISVQRAFLMAYLDGDGWRAGVSGYQCCTTSKQLADDIMQIALHCGFVPRYMGEQEGRSVNQLPIHRVSLSTGPIAWQRNQNHWSTEKYNGTVHCPELENGIFYIRRNGKCTWTGNTREASTRLWDELTPVPTRKRSIRFVETYAGFEGESSLLKDQYELGRSGRRLTVDDVPEWAELFPGEELLPIWINPIARMFMYWDEGPIARRMPWQTPEYYAEEAVSLRPSAFNRLHNNYWTSAVSDFIPLEWWDRQDLSRPENKAELALILANTTAQTPSIIAADASVSNDCTGIARLTRHPSRSDEVVVWNSQKWSPTAAQPIDYDLTLKPSLIEWTKKYNVVQIAYDAYQLHHLMNQLRNDAVAWCRPFSQATDRNLSDKQLFDLIRDRKIWHFGDNDIREHLKNAAAKQSKDEDTKLRIVKKTEKEKIDLAICLSMASFEVLRLNI